jgi:hypothetical protein
MDVNVAKSNAMASHPVSDVDASILSAFTLRILETVPTSKSNANPSSVRLNTTNLTI